MSGTKVIVIKKKVKGAHAHHGGAWKVAYADFVTAMMALFMVLWLVSQTNEDTQAQIATYFRTGVLSGGRGALAGWGNTQTVVDSEPDRTSEDDDVNRAATLARREVERAALNNRALSRMMREGRIQIEPRADGLLIQITDGSEGLLFSLGSATPSDALVALLSSLSPALDALGGDIQIHGHTDARPFGDGNGAGRSNWDLSFERANSARLALEQHGLPRGRIVSLVAHADTDPLNPADVMDPSNRRLSVYVLRRRPRAAAQGTGPGSIFRPGFPLAGPSNAPSRTTPRDVPTPSPQPAHHP